MWYIPSISLREPLPGGRMHYHLQIFDASLCRRIMHLSLWTWSARRLALASEIQVGHFQAEVLRAICSHLPLQSLKWKSSCTHCLDPWFPMVNTAPVLTHNGRHEWIVSTLCCHKPTEFQELFLQDSLASTDWHKSVLVNNWRVNHRKWFSLSESTGSKWGKLGIQEV